MIDRANYEAPQIQSREQLDTPLIGIESGPPAPPP